MISANNPTLIDVPVMVMLVDDQPMVGEVVRRLLEGEPDIDFHYSSQPADALEVAGRIHPTVILQDLVMPDVDGLDLVRRFRANPRTADTPIIVLSTREDPEVKSDAFLAGANDYLVKLPDRVELIARVRYHSAAYLNLLQRDEAFRALRESQRHLVEVNTALTAANQALQETIRSRDAEVAAKEEALSALAASEERFRELAQHVPQVFWITSADGERVLYVSPAYEAIWGRPAETLEEDGRAWADAIHPEDRDAALGAFLSAAGGEYSHEYRITRADGRTRWIRDRSFPIRDDAGIVRRIAGIAEDITEQKQAEQEIRDAKEEAVAANAAKSVFLSRMNHELRTPLHAILGFGQLLAADDLAPESREAVDQILNAGQHLLILINQVLDVARIESGRIAAQLEPVPLDTVVQEVLGMMAVLASGRGVGISAPGPWDVCLLADRKFLKQVLLNLLSNAIKYNVEGGAIEISCASAPGDRVAIRVRDTGAGLSAEQLERLFTPFDRVGAEKGAVEGTGIGLALSKRLVEAMNGSITVESAPGKGSTFTVVLPEATGYATAEWNALEPV